MMDILFNQDYVTKVHEDNLVWRGYDLAKKEIQKAENEVQKAKKEIQKAKKEIQKAEDKAQKAENEVQKAKNEAQKASAESQRDRENFVKSIKIMMSVQNATADQVMDQLGIAEDEREKYRKMMK